MSEYDDKVIFLVEDNRDDVALTLRALKKNSITSQVVVARDGVEALDYLFGTGAYEGRDTSAWPSIILLDLKLPKVNGLDVLRRLREDSRFRFIPVIVLTSSIEGKDLVQAYGLGANSYIRKPVDFSQFSEAIRQIAFYWLSLNVSPPQETMTQAGLP